jgi:hypothetical protein
MRDVKAWSLLLVLLLLPRAAGADGRTIDWVDLVPESERATYDPAPPPPVHDYLSGDSAALASMQVMKGNVNEALDGQQVRLPGYVVPLELDEEGRVTEFFLVPYFGACIHVPPPPPNQMVYVVMDRGIDLGSMYSAYWISGTMATRRRDTSMGAAAYTLAGTRAEEYKF